MIQRILELATGARAAIALAVFGFGGTALFRRSPYETVKALLDGASLPEETITSSERLAEILGALDASGRALYLEFQLWDVLNPILMGAAGAMLLGWLVKRSRRSSTRWRFVVLLPVALLVADLLENVILSAAVGAFPERALLAGALPLVTALKFAAAMATALAVVLVAGAWIRDRHSGVPPRTP